MLLPILDSQDHELRRLAIDARAAGPAGEIRTDAATTYSLMRAIEIAEKLTGGEKS